MHAQRALLECDDPPNDLHVERFVDEPPDGPMKTFMRRGITDSPPYLHLHDGRCLTLGDTSLTAARRWAQSSRDDADSGP